MKYPLLIALIALFAACKKTSNIQQDQLPPITQEGKNTFGCLINGKVYVPKGFEQNKPAFDMIVDPEFNNGSIDIRTFNKESGREFYLNIGSDSVKNIGNYIIKYAGRTGFNFYKDNNNISICQYLSKYDPSTSGFLKITKYDLNNKIFSGEFEFHFVNTSCGLGDTIHITQGRFDKKLN